MSDDTNYWFMGVRKVDPWEIRTSYGRAHARLDAEPLKPTEMPPSYTVVRSAAAAKAWLRREYAHSVTRCAKSPRFFDITKPLSRYGRPGIFLATAPVPEIADYLRAKFKDEGFLSDESIVGLHLTGGIAVREEDLFPEVS